MMNPDTDAFVLTKTLPHHGWCFVCGDENPHGIGLTWQASFKQEAPDAEGQFPPGAVLISADFSFKLAQQGPPGHAHGGASASVIDEAMGASVWQSGYRALLAHYELDYKLPVPLNTPVRVEAWVEKVDGRKVYARGHILLADGQVAVEGSGLYLHIPGFFEENQYHRS
jgi:acyl-coenzyme A thioesterase PaaI-like protein